ncbi:MAG TPA: class I SAM-dependent methyltransferase [Salinivirgaceae bacterium]|nr:class I SAM-dependent methyltransferase [Salinivirgaceae bacterium]
MGKLLFSLFQYLNYRLKASHRKGHGIHSPLIFRFIENVLRKKSISEIERQNITIFKQLSADKTPLEIEPQGALKAKKTTTIGQLAQKSTTRTRYRFLLGHIAQFYEFETVIELGTSLGITAHLLSKSTKGTVTTVEGSETLAKLASNNLKKWNCNNCQVIHSDFDAFISQLKPLSNPALVYLDGNHTFDATIRYYSMFRNLLLPGSILVIGDIYWSPEMKKAWDSICQISENRYTVDLFGIGLCFFHTKAAGNHFIIAY